MNVGIPGIGMTGLDIAVALGGIVGLPRKRTYDLKRYLPE